MFVRLCTTVELEGLSWKSAATPLVTQWQGTSAALGATCPSIWFTREFTGRSNIVNSYWLLKLAWPEGLTQGVCVTKQQTRYAEWVRTCKRIHGVWFSNTCVLIVGFYNVKGFTHKYIPENSWLDLCCSNRFIYNQRQCCRQWHTATRL